MTAEAPNPFEVIGTCLERMGRRELLARLNLGLTPEEIRRQLRAASLPESRDVELLYTWRNGTEIVGVRSADDIHLFPGYYFLSLADALTSYRSFILDRRWMPGWLPVFANGGGDFYFIDLGEELFGAVRHFRIDQVESPVEFRSMYRMIYTIGAGFTSGIIYVDDLGYLEMDDIAFAALATELNPDVPWWAE